MEGKFCFGGKLCLGWGKIVWELRNFLGFEVDEYYWIWVGGDWD